MTDELKAKIVECLTVHKRNCGGYYLLSNEKITELLAIIDEEIDEEFERGVVVGMNEWERINKLN